MSWSRPIRAMALAGILLGAGGLLGACSFSPVYSGTLANQPSLNLAYAKPNSRLEQVIYQELALRLGSSTATTAPLVSVAVDAGSRTVGFSETVNPSKARSVTVTATLTITPRDGSSNGKQTFTRTATAEYTGNDQVLADTAALDEARERAAKAAAESLRLAVLAALSR